MRARSALTVAGLAVAATLGTAGVASADPSKGDVGVPVVCDNGITYAVAVNGNGNFTPAHDMASTTVLVPTSFGEFHGTITDSDGNVIDSFTDPPMTKGNSGAHARATTTSCVYTITNTFEDPDLGTLTFTGGGVVTGFVTPVR
jgi:hypothetical protein